MDSKRKDCTQSLGWGCEGKLFSRGETWVKFWKMVTIVTTKWRWYCWLFPWVTPPGQALHCPRGPQPTPQYCSYAPIFTNEEIKAQWSLSHLYKIRHLTNGRGEGFSRSKSKIRKRETAWILHRCEKEHSLGSLESQVWWESLRLERKTEGRSHDRNLFTSLQVLERHGRAFSRTYAQIWASHLKEHGLEGWEEEMRPRWAELVSVVCKEPPLKMCSSYNDLFSSKHQHDF